MINLISNKYVQILFIIIATSVTSLHGDAFEPSRFWENYLSEQNEPNKGLTSQGSTSFFKQWFTGPLLVPSPLTMPVKHPVFEPSITVIDTYGTYGDNWKIRSLDNKIWTVQFLPYWQVGLYKHLGLDIFTALNCNYTKHASSTHFMDITARLGYQILTDLKEEGSWTPNLRIIFEEIFPTGNYQNLKASKQGTDLTGQGSFQSGIYIAFEKGFNYHTNHAFNLYGVFSL